MNINRNNYEDYFLLYIDNELSQAERKLVEDFVQQHTDLKQELQMLQQTVLAADFVAFDHKRNLLKPEGHSMEKLLLYLDGELSTTEAAILQNELRTDKALGQEWELLQKTKLQSQDKVVFENKEVLMRREPARIIPVRWWRAAAAIFIGLSLVGTLLVVNSKSSKQAGAGIAKQNSLENNNTAGKQIITENKDNTSPAAPSTNVAADVAANPQQPAAASNKEAAVAARDKSVNTNKDKRQELVVAIKENNQPEKENNTIRERLENFNSNKSNEKETLTVQLQERIAKSAAAETISNTNLTGQAKPVVESALKTNNASYAVNSKMDETAQNDYLSPDDKKFRRSGLIRKVSRFFQRTTKKKADGDGLKIAGFEFAVR